MDRKEAGPSGMQQFRRLLSRDREAMMQAGRIAGATGGRKVRVSARRRRSTAPRFVVRFQPDLRTRN